MREDQGAEIIKALTGRDAPVVVDPTMLLKKDTWLEHFAAAPRKKLPARYLLTYCLTVSRENAARIKQAARETGLPVIRINNPADRFFSATPKEFVYLLSHAELVLTNSFHGHAMSAILEKPYLSLQSASAKQSRLKTFAKKVQNIAAEREKGLTFLREAL